MEQEFVAWVGDLYLARVGSVSRRHSFAIGTLQHRQHPLPSQAAVPEDMDVVMTEVRCQ